MMALVLGQDFNGAVGRVGQFEESIVLRMVRPYRDRDLGDLLHLDELREALDGVAAGIIVSHRDEHPIGCRRLRGPDRSLAAKDTPTQRESVAEQTLAPLLETVGFSAPAPGAG